VRSGSEELGPDELIRVLRDPELDLFGTVVSTVDVVFAEIAASRFDLVWIDLEHSALSPRDVQLLVVAAQSAGAFSFVRLGDTGHEAVGALLDTGVDGVVLPRADDASEVKDVAAKLQFPPRGTRGFAPRRNVLARPERALAGRPACVVQIESQAAVANAAAIAEVEVCDALIVGTADLSLDLGVPLDLDSRDLANAVNGVREAALAAGKGWGVAGGGDVTRLHRLCGGDFRATLIYGSDVRLFAEIIDQRAQALRQGR
jgi:4-hydroxy-2-oxoheptanedioate aldolase